MTDKRKKLIRLLEGLPEHHLGSWSWESSIEESADKIEELFRTAETQEEEEEDEFVGPEQLKKIQKLFGGNGPVPEQLPSKLSLVCPKTLSGKHMHRTWFEDETFQGYRCIACGMVDDREGGNE